MANLKETMLAFHKAELAVSDAAYNVENTFRVWRSRILRDDIVESSYDRYAKAAQELEALANKMKPSELI
jgi:hypothetical protein